MIIVTGGAGFIGSAILAGLEDQVDDDLLCVDHLGTDEAWRNVAKRDLAGVVHPDNLFAELDQNRHAIRAVIHMGAISATTERDVDKLIHNNVDLTLALWSWCATHGKPFIYASSAATYGDGTQGFEDGLEPLSRYRPLNAYGWSKHLTDRRIARLLRQGRPAPPQWVGLKFFNVYGPNEYHKGSQRSVVSQVFDTVNSAGRCTLFRSHREDVPDGGQKRDFVWVGDCVKVILWLLENQTVSGLFNLGTGEARSFLDLANAVFAAMDREPAIDWVDTPEAIRDRYQYFTEAPMGALRGAGYDHPFTSLEEGVQRYVQQHLMSDDAYL